MKPVHSNTSIRKPHQMAFFQGDHVRKNHDTVKILRNKQEKLNRQLDEGLSEDLEEAQASILDDYFRDSFGASKAGFDLGLVSNPYAIVATGSYGRKEICRNPSVSVLFIFNNSIPAGTIGLVREIVYPLWDLGFTVTHSTKTLKDCITTSSKDFGTLVSLIDSRFICGISPLYSRLMSQIREKIVFNRKKDILHFIYDRDETRSKEFRDPDLLREPDLIYGPGGLKDYQSILSAARVAYGLIHPEEMETKKLLPADEWGMLSESLRFIRRILSRNRKGTRLQIKDQHAAARSMGYVNGNGLKGVDRFLSDLTLHMHTILTVRRQFYMNLMPEKFTHMPISEGEIKTGTRWITISRGMVQITSSLKLRKHPDLLLSVFQVSDACRVPLSPDAIRLIKENLILVNNEFIKDSAVMELFEKTLFSAPPGSETPRMMIETGLVGTFIPEFNAVIHKRKFSINPSRPAHAETVRILSNIITLIQEKKNDLSDENRRALLWACLLYYIPETIETTDGTVTGSVLARMVLSRFLASEKLIQNVGFLLDHKKLPGRLIHFADLSEQEAFKNLNQLTVSPEKMIMLYLLGLADLLTEPSGYHHLKREDLRLLFAGFSDHQVKENSMIMTNSNIETHDFFHIEYLSEQGLRYVHMLFPFFEGLVPFIVDVFLRNGIDVYDAKIHAMDQNDCRVFIRAKSPVDAMFEYKKWSDIEHGLNDAIKLKCFTVDNKPDVLSDPVSDPVLLNKILGRDPIIDIHMSSNTEEFKIHLVSNRSSYHILQLLKLLVGKGLSVHFFRKTLYEGSCHYLIHGKILNGQKCDSLSINEAIHDYFR